MKKASILLFFCSTVLWLQAQEKLLIFDLQQGTRDSMNLPAFDTTIKQASTPYNVGSFNNVVANLPQTPPVSNVYTNTQFTRKQRAAEAFDVNSYPLRTSVKIFRWVNGKRQQLCSGSLVSERHVLTAAHCVSNVGTNLLSTYDSIMVLPASDNDSLENPNFGRATVRKLYFFKDWSLGVGDIALLELREPIGKKTGWLGIGFETSDTALMNGLFFKFSYPAISNLFIDPAHYNGDTLYYNYGVVDDVSPGMMRITGTDGIQGESGSSLIKIENGMYYTSYGTLSLASDLGHTRIDNKKYYAFSAILDPYLSSNPKSQHLSVDVYPNPVGRSFFLTNRGNQPIRAIQLYNQLGSKVLQRSMPDSSLKVSIEHLPSGVYYLHLVQENGQHHIQKLIKA